MDSYERRFNNSENETVVFEAGEIELWSDGWFCTVAKQGLCVEDYGRSKASALRKARKAWKKQWEKKEDVDYGYPRVLICKDANETTKDIVQLRVAGQVPIEFCKGPCCNEDLQEGK